MSTVEQLFHSIIQYKTNSRHCIETFNCYYMCQFITSEVLDKLALSQLNSKKGCDIVDFVRILVNVIPHSETENLFVVMGLIDLFREIKQTGTKENIRLSELTDFVCDKYRLIYRDHEGVQVPPKNQTSKVYVLDISYDHNNKQMIIATQRDIRFLDIRNGNYEIMFKDLFEEDDITIFRTIHYGKQAIIGNQKGELFLIDLASGEKLNQLVGHSSDINQIQIDYFNRIIVTAGYDYSIQAQMSTGYKYEVKRKITQFNNKKIVTFMDLSVHHNVLLTCTDGSLIYVWDYEFNRLLATIVLEQCATATCLCFLNGLSVIFLATSEGDVHLIKFEKSETQISLRLIATMNLEDSIRLANQNQQTRDMWVHHKQQNSPRSPRRRQNKSVDDNSISNFKISFKRNTSLLQDDYVREKKQSANQILCDCLISFNSNEQIEIQKCILLLASGKGQLIQFNITQLMNFFLQQDVITHQPHANTRTNYNPFRNSQENFSEAVAKTKTLIFSITEQISPSSNRSFLTAVNQKIERMEVYVGQVISAHTKKISQLTSIHMDSTVIVTASKDGQLKLWEPTTLKMMGALNLNNNAGKVWHLKVDDFELNQKKILFALKTIEVILHKYQGEISKEEAKILSVNRLFDVLTHREVSKEHNTHHKIVKNSKPTHNESKKLIIDQARINKVMEQVNHREVQQEDLNDNLFQFLSPNYRQYLIKNTPLLSVYDNGNSTYWRLVKTINKREKQQQQINEPILKTKSKQVSTPQIRLQTKGGPKFASIASLNLKDSDSEPSGEIPKSDFTASTQKHSESQNFYTYAQQKNLVKTQNQWGGSFMPEKKAFSSVMANLRTQKMNAMQGRREYQGQQSRKLNQMLQPDPTAKLNPTQSANLEPIVDGNHQVVKSRVASILSEIKSSILRQTPQSAQSDVLARQFRNMVDPDFNQKLEFAQTNGFSRMRYRKKPITVDTI